MALVPNVTLQTLGDTTVTQNENFLSPLGFRFQLNRTPNVEYYCQAVSLPTISMNEALQHNPFNQIPRPGDKITYEPLTIRFRVDEDMLNYSEIHDWMIALGFPENFTQYDKDNVYSDGSMIVNTSNNNANIRIAFEDMFPIALSPLAFDVTSTDVEYLEAEVTFRYRMFKLENLA